ncbi:MAG TPA: GAP family protein [Acidimicrobiia bacterium]|jgi:threonine/homoserine/homoserine lactone efflux protein
MGRAISEVLPFAIGVAISPATIIAVILVLFSARARVNGPVFALGWVVGVAVVSVVVYLVADAGDVRSGGSASDGSYWAKLVAGVLLVLLAFRHLRRHPAPGETPAQPKWMAAIDTLTPVKAAGLAVLLAAANPKNLALSLAAGASLAQAGASGGEAAVGLAVFVVIASVSVVVPVVLSLTAGERAAHVLDGWRAWLSAHNAAMMAVLFLVFGVVLFSQGLRGLT